MSNKSMVMPCVLAAIAGVFFMQGITVLIIGRGLNKHGQHKKDCFNA